VRWRNREISAIDEIAGDDYDIPGLWDLVVEEAEEEELDAEAVSIWELKAARKRRQEKLLADFAKLGLTPSAPKAEAAPQVVMKPSPKKVVDPGPLGLSSEDAEEFLPPGCDISKYVGSHEARWRVQSPHFANKSKQRSRLFGEDQNVSDYAAMKFVIKLAWYMEKAKGSGMDCPWEFESDAEDEGAQENQDVQMEP
jgi:hypothetical protein